MRLTIPIEVAACFTPQELQVMAARFIERLRIVGRLNNSGGNTLKDEPPKETLTNEREHTAASK